MPAVDLDAKLPGTYAKAEEDYHSGRITLDEAIEVWEDTYLPVDTSPKYSIISILTYGRMGTMVLPTGTQIIGYCSQEPKVVLAKLAADYRITKYESFVLDEPLNTSCLEISAINPTFGITGDVGELISSDILKPALRETELDDKNVTKIRKQLESVGSDFTNPSYKQWQHTKSEVLGILESLL